MKAFPTKTHTGRWSVLLAVFTAMIGIALSLFLHSRISKAEAETAQLAAESLRLNTEQELGLFVEVLESVRALHALSGAIDQAAMDEFIEKGLVHQQAVMGAFGLAQRIDPQMRVEIESKSRPAPGAYDIVEKGTNGTWTAAGIRPVYYPLTWQSHTGGLNIPVGYDFASEDEARRVITGIQRTRRTVLVPEPIALPGAAPNSYWVFSPVMPRGAPTRVIGLAVAVLHPDTILKKVSGLAASSPGLQLTPVVRRPETTIRLKDKAWQYRGPLEAIGTLWTFECSLPVNMTERRSTAVLATGLIITALMSCLLLILASRTRSIEAEVLTRTEQLRVANIQLEENLRERALMEEEMNELAARERRRIGRDLHDSLGQKLTGAVFLSRSQLNWLRKTESRDRRSEVGDQRSEIGGQRSEVGGRKTENGDNSELETGNSEHGTLNSEHGTLNSEPETLNSELTTQITHAKTLNDTLKSAVAQVRNMARGLASVTLNEESLEESFDQLADEMSALYDVACTVRWKGTLPDLDRKTKEQLYFIAREAVNNAAKHARPKQIVIRVNSTPPDWTLKIEDDGQGLPENRVDEGMGLRTMRHRAIRIGAQFSIESTPGSGTVIEVKSANEPPTADSHS